MTSELTTFHAITSRTGGDAMLKCVTCGGAFCDDCGAHHARSLKTKTHTIKPFAEVGLAELKAATAVRECERHNQPLTMFCETCQTTICMM
jgi:hypothetical protein